MKSSHRHLLVALALAALGALLVGAAGAATAATKVTLSVRVNPAGSDRIILTGRVMPSPRSARLEIQVHRSQGWRNLAGGRLKHGAFKISTHGTGSLTLRALAFQGRRKLGVSEVRTIQVEESAPGGGSAGGSPSSKGSSSGGSSSGGGPPAGGGPPSGGESPPSRPDTVALSAESLMATIESYSSLSNHLSGTPNSAAAENEFQANLAAAGLKLGEQAFTFPRFAVSAVGLSAGGSTVPQAAIAPLLYSGTTGPEGVTAELFDGGKEGGYDQTKVKGKIVVVSIPYAANNSKALGLYPAIEKAVVGEAAGLVAVTLGVGNYPKWEDVNARLGTGTLPVLMVGKHSGEAVIKAAKEGGKQGTLILDADQTGVSCDRDVWGELEGAEPSRRVFVGVPASSYTPSASEHGTGVAITVGLARYYASLPKSQRPETLVFIALSGHEIGWLGLQALLNSPQAAWFQDADAYVHLGSALGTPTEKEEADGTIVTTPKPDPTGRLHNSENPLLVPSIIEDFAAAGVPTEETPPFEASGGEQTNAYAAGIPTASFSGASLFFHTAGDLPSTVDPTILAKDADAFRRSVDTITAIPPGVLKADHAHAAELGSQINAAIRAPINPTTGSGQPGAILGSGGAGGPPATAVAHCS